MLGRSMLVLRWLVGWVGGRGGGGSGLSAMVDKVYFWKITRAKHGRMLNFGRGTKNNKKHNGPQKLDQNEKMRPHFSNNFGEVFVEQS